MKSSNFMKACMTLLVSLFTANAAHAQFLRTSYFMEGTHYRMQLNPALTPGRGYINLPVVGSFNATVNSSSLGFQDVCDIIDNSDGSDYFLSRDFRNRLENTNNLNVNFSTDILSAGWYKGKNFWSFNIGLRTDVGASIPRSMFDFMYDMDQTNWDNPLSYANINESVGQQKLNINSYTEIGIGWARDINSRLKVGAKVKALLGIGNLELQIDQIKVNSNISGISSDTDWSNLTLQQLQNVRGNASVSVDATLESSFKGLVLEENEMGYIDEFDVDTDELGLAGYGAAIDLGVSYKLLKNLTLSASVLDLGFIKWDKSSTTIARAGMHADYDLTNSGQREEFVEMVSSGEVLNYDMLKLERETGTAKSRTSKLTSTVVVGAEYALLKNWLVLGALYTGRFAEPKTLNELTFSANIRPKNYFNLAASYSVLQGAGKTFGVAMKLGPLFVGTDYMFFGEDTKNVNAYVGLSIPLGKQKKL
ncbi:MAG: hypothetical protein IJ511_06975 [Bacteroides sp.]|nr:hypothetical protein [Bacteroides sp.]